ncbi:MAG: RING-HC finger protein [Patescibacteria group bacterium]
MAETLQCPICLEQGGVLIPIGCPSKHLFCEPCSSDWLMDNFTCPYCRQEISNISESQKFIKFFRSGYGYNFREKFIELSKEAQVEVVRKHETFLTFLSDDLKTPELWLQMVKKRKNIIHLIPKHLITEEIFRISLEYDQYSLSYVPDHLKTPELCLKAIIFFPHLIALGGFVPKKIMTPEFLISFLESRAKFFMFIPYKLRTLKIYRAAASKDRSLLSTFPERIQRELEGIIS